MYRADYHIHTAFSCDSDEHIDKIIDKAINIGLDEICITDHIEFFPDNRIIKGHIKNNEELPIRDVLKHLEMLQQKKDKYKDKLKIKIGFEVDGDERDIIIPSVNNFLDNYIVDFCILSKHQLEGYMLGYDYDFSNKTKMESYSTYFEAVLKSIKRYDNFSVYGHLDYISRYSNYSDKKVYYKEFSDHLDLIFKALIEKGCGLEINTSGIRYKANDLYPSVELLKQYKKQGGEILTIGSDSHVASNLGLDFDLAYRNAKEAGFNYYTTFEDKKPIFNKIDI